MMPNSRDFGCLIHRFIVSFIIHSHLPLQIKHTQQSRLIRRSERVDFERVASEVDQKICYIYPHLRRRLLR